MTKEDYQNLKRLFGGDFDIDCKCPTPLSKTVEMFQALGQKLFSIIYESKVYKKDYEIVNDISIEINGLTIIFYTYDDSKEDRLEIMDENNCVKVTEYDFSCTTNNGYIDMINKFQMYFNKIEAALIEDLHKITNELIKDEDQNEHFKKIFFILNSEEKKNAVRKALSNNGIETEDCIVPCILAIDENNNPFIVTKSGFDALVSAGYKEF